MQITTKNKARLASISALGAGALGLAAGTAEAGVINTINYTPLAGKVGFSPGYGSNFSVNPPGISFLRFVFSSPGYFFSGKVGMKAGTGVQLLSRKANANSTWSQVGGSTVAGQLLASQLRVVYSGAQYSTAFLRFGGGNYYKLFKFQPASIPLYGWINLSASIGPSGPDVQILGWAYDTEGNPIAAGVQSNGTEPVQSTPEPSTAVSLGLAALAMGASGLRRWRAARKQAA